MIVKTQLPDGRWAYFCEECAIVRVVRFSDLKNPCDCVSPTIYEIEYSDDVVSSWPGQAPSKTAQQKKRRRCKHLGPATGEQWPPKDGAGDYLAHGLTAIGVTKERWATAVASFTGSEKTEGAGCSSCEGRQKKINHVGEWLGIGKKSAEVRRLLDLEEGKGFPTFACAVHGTCLTTAAAKGIAAAPHSCVGCEERDLVEIALPPAPPRSSDEATGA